MFERSNPVPVSFTFTPSTQDLALKICSQPQRLERLVIQCSMDFLETVMEKLSAPAPFLQQLKLEGLGRRIGEEVILPAAQFLGNEAPQLRHLELEGFTLPWQAISFKSLRTMKIHNTRWRDSPLHPEPDSFFNAMGEMKDSLRDLDLSGVDLPIKPLPSNHAILFPRMERLKLRASSRECENVLRHFAIPITATLQLSSTDRYGNTPSSVSTLGSAITSSWLASPLSNSGTPPSLKSLMIDESNSSSMEGSFQAVVDIKQPALKMRVEFPGGPWATHVAPTLPLDNLEILSLFNCCSVTTLLSTFSTLPRLHTVCVDRFGIREFYQHIADDPAFQSQNFTNLTPRDLPPAPLTRFPSLTTLICRGVHFGHSSSSLAIPMDAFEQLLTLRSERGRPLRSLKLEKCIGWNDYNVNELRKIVDNVEWDGVIRFS
ncbi:hypothetical protein CC2G_009901 [Coprinopsis cinerea AmutBmut pab1-1]|nr:hypothetical protein CC2G_009901 [Coprinopsis cinerea AmutBmut pab1-1]